MERNFTMGFSRYQNKIRKTWEKTESGRIALTINDSAMEYKSRQSIVIGDIKIESSDDGLALYIWKPVDYKANRSWYKVIPNCRYSVEQLVKCLDAQPWNYL